MSRGEKALINLQPIEKCACALLRGVSTN